MSALSTPACRIRAVFVDIDGTLVGQDNRVSPAVVQSLRAAREAGCEIVLCTGRSRYTAMSVVKQIGDPYGFLIYSNGSVVMHLDTRELLCCERLPIPSALQIVRAMVEAGGEPYVYEDAVGEGVEAARVLHHPDLPCGDWAVRPRYRPYAGILENLPFEPVCVCTFGTPERIQRLVERLRILLPTGFSIVESGTDRYWGVEIFAEGVTKASGLAHVARRLGISREEVMAIGDHANDVEMLRWAGIGVAMGNSLPSLAAAADWITAPLEEDGVARAIEKFVLNA